MYLLQIHKITPIFNTYWLYYARVHQLKLVRDNNNKHLFSILKMNDWRFFFFVILRFVRSRAFATAHRPLFFHYPVRSKENGSFICWIVNVEHLSLRGHLKSNVDTLHRLSHWHRVIKTVATFVPILYWILWEFYWRIQVYYVRGLAKIIQEKNMDSLP